MGDKQIAPSPSPASGKNISDMSHSRAPSEIPVSDRLSIPCLSAGIRDAPHADHHGGAVNRRTTGRNAQTISVRRRGPSQIWRWETNVLHVSTWDIRATQSWVLVFKSLSLRYPLLYVTYTKVGHCRMMFSLFWGFGDYLQIQFNARLSQHARWKLRPKVWIGEFIGNRISFDSCTTTPR